MSGCVDSVYNPYYLFNGTGTRPLSHVGSPVTQTFISHVHIPNLAHSIKLCLVSNATEMNVGDLVVTFNGISLTMQTQEAQRCWGAQITNGTAVAFDGFYAGDYAIVQTENNC